MLHWDYLSILSVYMGFCFRWYSDLKGYVGLSFARDRVVECYLWGYFLFYEEEHTLPRMIFAKLFLLEV